MTITLTGEFSQKDFGQYVNDDNNVIVKIATDDIIAYIFRSAKGFRIAWFFLFENSAEKYRNDVSEWAKSVTFEK